MAPQRRAAAPASSVLTPKEAACGRAVVAAAGAMVGSGGAAPHGRGPALKTVAPRVGVANGPRPGRAPGPDKVLRREVVPIGVGRAPAIGSVNEGSRHPPPAPPPPVAGAVADGPRRTATVVTATVGRARGACCGSVGPPPDMVARLPRKAVPTLPEAMRAVGCAPARAAVTGRRRIAVDAGDPIAAAQVA